MIFRMMVGILQAFIIQYVYAMLRSQLCSAYIIQLIHMINPRRITVIMFIWNIYTMFYR